MFLGGLSGGGASKRLQKILDLDSKSDASISEDATLPCVFEGQNNFYVVNYTFFLPARRRDWVQKQIIAPSKATPLEPLRACSVWGTISLGAQDPNSTSTVSENSHFRRQKPGPRFQRTIAENCFSSNWSTSCFFPGSKQ